MNTKLLWFATLWVALLALAWAVTHCELQVRVIHCVDPSLLKRAR